MSDKEQYCVGCCRTLATGRKNFLGRLFRTYKVQDSSEIEFFMKNRQALTEKKKNVFVEITITVGDKICSSCRAFKDRNLKKGETAIQTEDLDELVGEDLPSTSQAQTFVAIDPIVTISRLSSNLIPQQSSRSSSDDESSDESIAECRNEASDEENFELHYHQSDDELENQSGNQSDEQSNEESDAESGGESNGDSIGVFVNESGSSSNEESNAESGQESDEDSVEESGDESGEESFDGSETQTASEGEETIDSENEYVPPAQLNPRPSTSQAPQIKRSISGHTTCIFRCRRPNSLRNVPTEKRSFCLIIKDIFVPKGARCCSSHLLHENDDWSELTPIEGSRLSIEELEEAVQLAKEPFVRRFFNRCFPAPTSEEASFYKNWTGLSPSQFCSLMESIGMAQSDVNIQSLAMTLMKLRKNLSYDDLASLTHQSRATIIRHFDQNIKLMCEKFVPLHLGYQSLTRQQAKECATQISIDLFDVPAEAIIVVADATYCYTQKSSNHAKSREFYLGYKSRNLFKPFIICCPNGRIQNTQNTVFSRNDQFCAL
uniref:Uncharacterized protein n=1 Tax=Tetranychus urticae TaxID=32264 RepID=T1JY13_TETUR